MTGDIVETRDGVEPRVSSGGGRVPPVVERGGGGTNVASSEVHAPHLMNGLTDGAGSESNTVKLEAVSAEGDNSSRSNQGSMRTSPGGDEVANPGGKRGSRRKGEIEGLGKGAETLQRLRVDRRSGKGTADSSVGPAGERSNLNERKAESSMFKQVKFEFGAAITQSGLTDQDDRVKAFDALAAVMGVHGIPKEVIGLAAHFPGEIGVGSKKLCQICKKPETAKHTIICDKCQRSYHLGCVKLKPKQAVDIENEHWQCETCGPELGLPYWPLGRITPMHDRTLADPRRVEPVLPVNVIEHCAVTLPATDVTVKSESGHHEGPGSSKNLNIPRTKDQLVVPFPNEDIMAARRSRGRPPGRSKKDSSALKEKITMDVIVDLGVQDSVLNEEQPALHLGNDISASQPSAVTPAISPIPLVVGTDVLTTTNDTGIQGDTANVILSDDGLQSEGKSTKDPEAMLEDLRQFIEEMGLKLEAGWEVIIKPRPSNPLLSNKIFISPDGHKFRSRLQVVRYLENPKSRTNLQSVAQRTNVQPTVQRLETPTQRADLSLEGLGSSREMPSNLEFVEPQDEREKRIEEKIPVVKESRSLPPSGDPLTTRLPIELVGDALEIWEFLCRFSDILDLKSPPNYEELETGLVNLGPSTSADTLSNVDVQNSFNPSSRENLGKVCAEAGHDSLHKPAGHLRDPCVEGSALTVGNAPNSVQGEDLKAAESSLNKIVKEANGLQQGMSVSVEAGSLSQSTTVQENGELILSPAESPGEKVYAMERAVASSDGTLNENFVLMARTHIPLLKLVLGDLQFRINGNSNVSKSEEPKKKGRKPLHEAPQDIPVDVPEFSSDLPINEVTWPELVRRYLITLVEAEKYGDLTELKLDDRKILLRCLQGDGGVPGGALYNVVGVESDAQVLAEAEKELAARLRKDGEIKEGEDEPVDGSDRLPAWVEALRPVAKMATNVGSRIRIKVKEALALDPPQWAQEQLEWSISKDVFKGNASGPTKKAVVEVLNHYNVSPCESPILKTKPRKLVPPVDQLMHRCRVLLRTLADADKSDTFSVLIGGPEGHGTKRLKGMVPRPLDFRTIDARLAAGAYGGSVDAFAEDMRQIWRNVELLQKGGEVMECTSNLSHLFEDLLQKQVISIPEVKVKDPKSDLGKVLEEGAEPANAPLTRSHLAAVEKTEDTLQKAPWQDLETCRVCEVDEDYESIMLCDTCDAEYHTYCLNPPLEIVPEGNWFCPECVALDKGFPDRPSGKDGEVVEPESLEGEDEQFLSGRNVTRQELKEVKGECAAQCLLKQIESKEYWQLGLLERVHLLKFLCNEAVKTTQVRAHLEKSVDLVFDLHQQLNDLHAERQSNLKTRLHIVKVFDSADIVKKRRNDYVESYDNEVTAEVGRTEANTPERLMTRNSKRAKFEEYSDDGGPQFEGTKVSATSKQTQNLGCDGLLFGSELQERQTVAHRSESKMPGVVDLEVQVTEAVESESQAGGRNIFVDESAESGQRVVLRSSYLSSERSDPSAASVKIGIAGAGLPPRTPKRKLETTLGSDTSKKPKTDATFNEEGLVDGKDHLIMLKDNFVGESQSVVGTAQGIPALGEVIDDPHRDEALTGPKRQEPLQSTQCTPIIESSALSKLDSEIVKLELKLYNTTLRRDHLGTDDVGREYWALSGPNRLPMLVASEHDVVGRGELFEVTEETYFSYVEQSERGSSDGEILHGDCTLNRSKEAKTRWWAYKNEASIDSLVAWLNPRVKAERALKSSICRWRETASLVESNQEKENTSSLGNGTDGSMKKEQDISKTAPKRFPFVKATSILQMRYGSSSFSDRVSNKKLTMPMEGRVIRCSCLEPLWKFKWHCQACHETYESLAELESHKSVCSEGVATISGKKKQKGGGKGKNNLTPQKVNKTATFEKGKKKSKAATPKKEGTKRSLESENLGVHTSEGNAWMSDDFTEPSSLYRSATRGKRQATSPGINGDLAVSEDPVEDAFFLSDFQDDVHNPGVEQEDIRTGFQSFSSLLQDDEWEANLRPERTELKRKKHGYGKKSIKPVPTQGTSEMALANFDYASLPMTFSTPDSTRDRILQIGCIADQGPTFAPALHFAPAFDPSLSLLIQPCYPDPSESPTDAGEFPGSSPLPSSQNGSPKDFSLDAVSWYDPQTSGDVKPDVVFAPDIGDTESVVQPGSGVTWDLAELVGLGSKGEYDDEPTPLIDGGCAEGVTGELDHRLNDQTSPLNTNGDGNQPVCTLNASGEELVFPIDALPAQEPEVLPVQEPEVLPAREPVVLPAGEPEVLQLEIVPAAVKTVRDMSLKKQSKKFGAPESSLRPLIGEQFGMLVGLKMRLLDMEAAMGVDALVPSKSAPPRRRAWRSLVKSAQCIYEMTKAVIILEQMVRPDCLKRTWCYWSSLLSAARSATLATLALRIFAFDAAITYKKDKVIADESQRPSTLKKPKKKIQVQVPLSSKKKANKAG